MTQTAQERRQDPRTSTGTYDIYIEIDCDCEELLDAIGLDYTRTQEVDALGNLVDSTQNEICLSLDEEDWDNFKFDCNFNYTDERDIGSILLNNELGEYVTKVTIYKPDGNIISFY